jgi:hypothetical protein
VTKNGGSTNAFESFDGKLGYYMKGRALWSVPPDGGEERKVLDSIIGGYALSRDGIYYLTKASSPVETWLQFQPFAGGPARAITSFRKPVYHLDVSSDSKWILFSQADSEGADLMLVENLR